MPSDSLLMIATLIGMPSIVQVASSWLVIWKQPSPSIAHTVVSGQPTLAPIAAGHGEAHRAEATGVDPGVRVLVADVVGGPHLVLADAGDVDRLGAGDLAEPLDDVLRGEALRGGVVPERVLLLHAGQELHPALVVAGVALLLLGLERDDQVGDHLAAVADDRHVGDAVLADLGRVDVGVDHLGAGGERVEVAGDPVVEPRAQADDQVALLQTRDRRDGAVHARHAEVLRVAVGEGAARHQRRDDRDAGELGEQPQLLAGAGADHAAADVEHRPARLEQQPGGLADLLGVRPGHGPVAGQVQLGRPRERGLRLERGLGDVDEHRTGATGRGDVERLGDHARDLVGVGDQEVVLGDRHRDAADVGLLEGVGADRGRGHLAGDGDHRHRVHVGVGDRRDQVGRARAAGGHADADLAGGDGVPLRGVAGALLVAHQDVPDLGVVEGVVRRQDRAAGDAEDVLRAGALERLDQALRAGDRPGSLVGRHRRALDRLLLRHLLIFPVSPSQCRTSCVSPTKNPSSRSADEGSTRVLRVLRPLSSRVACVRESRGSAQDAWAQHAPRARRRSTQSASRPESWDPESHHSVSLAVSRGTARCRCRPGCPPGRRAPRTPARARRDQRAAGVDGGLEPRLGDVVRDADVEVPALPVGRIGVGLLEPHVGRAAGAVDAGRRRACGS